MDKIILGFGTACRYVYCKSIPDKTLQWTHSYQEEIRSLEEVIDSLSTKNEQLSLEIIRLTSPTRLRSEGKRLGLQPSNRIIILPTD